MSPQLTSVRLMWQLLEPVAATVYFAPEVLAETAALGYDAEQRWPGYFALRAAPLGSAGPRLVTATFYSFSPDMVRRYVPGIWGTASPGEVNQARYRGLDRAFRALWPEAIDGPELAEAASLARRVAESADVAGRPLAAAYADLEWPDEPQLALWHAATIIREHRGDGHIAALQAHGLDPLESLVSFAAVDAAPKRVFDSRGWGEPAWQAAADRLAARGLIDAEQSATAAGRRLRETVETRTDELAAAPWAALGPDVARLAELVKPLMKAVVTSGMLPRRSTLGIKRP